MFFKCFHARFSTQKTTYEHENTPSQEKSALIYKLFGLCLVVFILTACTSSIAGLMGPFWGHLAIFGVHGSGHILGVLDSSGSFQMTLKSF